MNMPLRREVIDGFLIGNGLRASPPLVSTIVAWLCPAMLPSWEWTEAEELEVADDGTDGFGVASCDSGFAESADMAVL